jgi:hypothetical protein
MDDTLRSLGDADTVPFSSDQGRVSSLQIFSFVTGGACSGRPPRAPVPGRETSLNIISAPNRRKRIPLLLTGSLWHSCAGVEQIKDIPPRHAIPLDDLRAWHVIFATCAACGRRTHIGAALLQHGRPPYTRLLDLERKLRCGSCGNRQGCTLTVSMAPRN